MNRRVKLPGIPLPEPVWMITVTRGSPRSRRATVEAIRLALWLTPAASLEVALALAGHSRWLTIAAGLTAIAIAVLTVNAQAGSEEDQ